MSNTWDLQRLQDMREEILKAELAAWLHDAKKANISEDDLPENLRLWLKASDPSSVHPWKAPLNLWLLAQCHGIAHFDKQEPDKKIVSTHIDTPVGYPFRIPGVDIEQVKKWLSDLDDSNAAKTVLSSYRADSRYPINEVDLWSWSETTAALVKVAWLQAILSNISLEKPSLDLELLESLQRGIDVLVQREDSPKDFLEQLQKILPGNSFENLQLSRQDEDNALFKFREGLHRWLEQASKTKLQHKLTQKHWKEFLKNLSFLRKWLDKIISLLRWRLLSIRTNGLEYLLSASSIPDLKARQDLLQDAWDRVRDLLEEYPLALEVYRDENGPVFVVPDMEVLQLRDDRGTLEEHIFRTFAKGTIEQESDLGVDISLGQEIIPHLYLDPDPWKGQPTPQELPPIGKNWKDPGKKGHLEREVLLQSDPGWIARFWEPVRVSYKGKEFTFTEEICPLCRLRPQGWGAPDREQHYEVQARRKAGDKAAKCPDSCQTCKAIKRNRCYVCEKRRTNRAEKWAKGAYLSTEERNSKNVPETIWLDEVADENGRIALLVGTFDLTHWLDGTLVRSLAVRTPNDQNGHTAEDVAKNPSFARLRRIWETTRKFWEEALKEAEDYLDKRPRIFLKGTPDPQNALGPYHAYELEIQGRKVAVLWVPENAKDEKGNDLEYRGGFWIIENLEYLDQVYGGSFRELVQSLVGQTLRVYEPTEYGRPGKEQASFTIHQDGINYLENNYIPLIPILAEPRTFMALVPANKAFEVVKAIKTKYEREMGKVRNRLPLHLGIVFADSHQPLRTILDAGRRMLKQKAKNLLWRVVGEQERQVAEKAGITIKDVTEKRLSEEKLEEEHPELIYRDPEKKEGQITEQFKQWHRIVLLSEKGFRKCVITWFVPAVMGDGQTEDHWYPYVYWVKDKEGNTEPDKANRNRYYQAPNPFELDENDNPKSAWLVHAAELEPGDIIYFTPATFDFLWIGHGGDRFRLAYDKEGRRLGTLHRPYILDELEELERCWHLLAGEKRKDKDGKQEKSIKRLSSRQLHQVRDLIEGKRAEWFENPENSVQDPTFRNFCKDVLRNAEWTDEPTEKELKNLTQWAVNGLLADAVELFYHIMKERPLKDDQG